MSRFTEWINGVFNKDVTKNDFINVSTNGKKDFIVVPEMKGKKVWVRELNGLQLINFNNKVTELQKGSTTELNPSNSLELMSYLVSLTVCDAKGKLLFSHDEAKGLMNVSPSLLLTLSIKALELSGLNKAVGDITENLKKAKTSDSVQN